MRERTLKLVDEYDQQNAERLAASAEATPTPAPDDTTPPKPKYGDIGIFARVCLDGMFGRDPSARADEAAAQLAEPAPAPPEHRSFLSRLFHGDNVELDARCGGTIDALLAEPETVAGYPRGSSLIARRWARVGAAQLLNDTQPKDRTPERIVYVAHSAVRNALDDVEKTRALLASAAVGVVTMAGYSYLTSLIPWKTAMPVMNFLGTIVIGNSMSRAGDHATSKLRAASYSMGTQTHRISPAMMLDLTNNYLRLQRVNGLALSQRGDMSAYEMMMFTSARDTAHHLTIASEMADQRDTEPRTSSADHGRQTRLR